MTTKKQDTENLLLLNLETPKTDKLQCKPLLEGHVGSVPSCKFVLAKCVSPISGSFLNTNDNLTQKTPSLDPHGPAKWQGVPLASSSAQHFRAVQGCEWKDTGDATDGGGDTW